ncbi:YybH family protein [Pontibacter sp. CAU 1760]
MRNNLLLAGGLFLLLSCNIAKEQAVSTTNAGEAVREVLAMQSACWNKGDLECYMQGYWQSDSLLFIGSRGLTYGWQQTLQNYRKGYPDAAAMGQLSFDLKEVRPLSPETMLVVGRWHLKREVAAGDLQGHFSVIFRRFEEGWRIIADHSS